MYVLRERHNTKQTNRLIEFSSMNVMHLKQTHDQRSLTRLFTSAPLTRLSPLSLPGIHGIHSRQLPLLHNKTTYKAKSVLSHYPNLLTYLDILNRMLCGLHCFGATLASSRCSPWPARDSTTWPLHVHSSAAISSNACSCGIGQGSTGGRQPGFHFASSKCSIDTSAYGSSRAANSSANATLRKRP